MTQPTNRNSLATVSDYARQSVDSICGPIDEWLEENRQVLVGIRRHMHMHPEPSGQERETTEYLAGRLGEVGLQPRVLRDGLGLIVDATIGTPAPDAPRVAMRADIDALKIQDAKSVEYRSCRDGVMHACGHDVHSAIVAGVALAVAGRSAAGAQCKPAKNGGLRLV